MPEPGTVFWLTGLSGSGKTTIGEALAKTLRLSGHTVVFLDGDHLREVSGQLFGHERDQRLQASLLYSRLCKMLANQNIHVVCATISLFHETQEWNRKNIERYIEVFIDVPLTELLRRDSKKIYQQAKNGYLKNVVGIDISADYPQQPDLTIKNYGDIDPEQAVSFIINYLKKDYLYGSFRSDASR
ncbi:MAG: hypothetical protein A3F11_07415 [Gammaproteobacteria bacterium RIFCSPHIGHO2_12_FULL_37_14]|nr:MAG: hypothetical protein A3F11_07415 [Gammaproteobacteria bacterium RIFCSPHIGHO2_12_FULL_37_14]